MKIIPLPEREYLMSILNYDPDTGILTWKRRKKVKANVNTVWEGKKAGFINSKSYVIIKIDNQQYLAHRIAYKMYHGLEPNRIDHDNRIRYDNRIINLKNGDHQGNMKNLPMLKNNTSGRTGVSFINRDKRWIAFIGVDGKQVCLGYFKDINDAIKARAAAEIKYGFNENHGK